MTDADLCQIFGEGRQANQREAALEANPHTDPQVRDAWEAGWLEEEGGTFTVSPRARRDYRRATLGDIWPAQK